MGTWPRVVSFRLGLLLGLTVVVSMPAVANAQRETRRERVEAIREEAPASLRSWIEGLPENQRRVAVRRLVRMNDARRTRFFERWSSLSDDERTAFQQRMETQASRIGDGSGRRQQRAERREARRERRNGGTPFADKLQRWRSLSDGERQQVRERLQRFQELGPAEQEALVEKHFAGRSEDERTAILARLRSAGRR